MAYVTFRYPKSKMPNRLVHQPAAKAHQVATRGRPHALVEIVDGWDDYVAYCDELGEEPKAVQGVESEEAPEEFTWEKSGRKTYTVFRRGVEIGVVEGAAARDELIASAKDGESTESAESVETDDTE